MNNNFYKIGRNESGFSLAEVIVALIIAAMVLVAVLTIYSRAESTAGTITRRLDDIQMPSEVLQRIAEDLDDIITAGLDTKITVENRIEKGYSTARLTIERTFYDNKNNVKDFEKIVWQTSYDYDSEFGGLILYRSHSGIALEDKLLDDAKNDWERQLFIPMCSGVTFFKIQVRDGENLSDRWQSPALPKGVVATISFAEPFKTVANTLDVLDEEKLTRTIAIDRIRKIGFKIRKSLSEEDEKQTEDKQESAE